MKRLFTPLLCSLIAISFLLCGTECKNGEESDLPVGFIGGYLLGQSQNPPPGTESPKPPSSPADPASDNAYLESLVITPGVLEPDFTPENTTYTVGADIPVESVQITATAEDAGAVIMINASPATSGTPSDHQTPNLGENTITIEVTAANGETKMIYTVHVIRAITAQQAYLKAANNGAGDSFGYSVAVSGDTIVVGAPYEDSDLKGVTPGDIPTNENSSASGAAYVFVRNGASWSQQAFLKASNPGVQDYFGSRVAISGDTIVVGAPNEDGNSIGVTNDHTHSGTNDGSHDQSGAAYVFVRDNATKTWSQQAYIKAANSEANDYFGSSVAISGDTIVVGATGEDGNAIGVTNGWPVESNSMALAGAAYVYVRAGNTWSFQSYLKAANPDPSDRFGSSVSISGDTIVVGASYEDGNATGVTNGEGFSGEIDGLNNLSGAAYVFVRTNTTWSQQAYLKAANTGADDRFGSTVSISGDTVVVGAPNEDGNVAGVFQGDLPIDLDPNSTCNNGAVYVFVRTNTTWSQQAYLKASNTGVSDLFGVNVAISGNIIIVGANGEDGNGTGVTSGGDISGTDDNGHDNSGAVYVFMRDGTTWSQQGYLKAANTGASDGFGFGLAITDETIVIGALYEDSDWTGVIHGSDLSQTTDDGSHDNSGAVYVFH